MQHHNFHALVVDDEPLVRNLTIHALRGQGFTCEAAADGLQAKEIFGASRYDLVVTDLRMPNRHGYALATELLKLHDRPVVIILTGVLEPKLAADLISRGVDHVEFKPVRYELFAAMARALVKRRREESPKGSERVSNDIAENTPTAAATSVEPATDESGSQNSSAAAPLIVDAKSAQLSKILPVSQAAFEVFSMASSDAYDTRQIANAIARDAALVVDVLRIANSAFHNPTGKKTIELHEAVLRIGQKRIGEVALATSALAALSKTVLPWMNLDLAWRRSIAAGAAVELLVANETSVGMKEGLFLCAVMHGLGRVVLATLHPKKYEEMIKLCEQRQESLLEHEKRCFGVTYTEFMARILEAWNIPASIYEPLKYINDDYASLARLPNPLRFKAELVKLASLIGQIAAGPWESWDLIEFPPAPVIRRLTINSLPALIKQTQLDSDAICNSRSEYSAPSKRTDKANVPNPPPYQLAYCNLSQEPFDFLAEIVSSMNIELFKCDADALKSDGNAFVNCIWAVPHRLAAKVSSHFSSRRLIIANADSLEPYRRFGRVLAIPSSYAALQSACESIAANTQE